MFGIDDALLAGGAQLAGGLLGKLFSHGDKDKAIQAAQDAYSIIDKLGAPPDLAKQILMDKFQSAGLYSPHLEDAINQTVSQVSKISTDPRLKDAQMSALGSLQKSGRTGFTAQDRASLNQQRQDVQRDEEAKRQQIIQNLQARGQAGGGAELAASLQASQSGADRASAEGDRTAAQASQNALNAIAQAGQLGGQVRGQDFSEAQTKASALDEMNRFNINNAINRQQRNVNSQNQGEQTNLANSQAIMNANTQQANAEKLRELQGQQQNFANNAALAQMKEQAKLGQASAYSGQANQTAGNWANIGQGVSEAIGAHAAYNTPKAPSADEASVSSYLKGLSAGGGTTEDAPSTYNFLKDKNTNQVIS